MLSFRCNAVLLLVIVLQPHALRTSGKHPSFRAAFSDPQSRSAPPAVRSQSSHSSPSALIIALFTQPGDEIMSHPPDQKLQEPLFTPSSPGPGGLLKSISRTNDWMNELQSQDYREKKDKFKWKIRPELENESELGG